MKEFFDMIKAAVCGTGFSYRLDRHGWEQLYELSKKHAILGVLSPVLDALPNESKAPLGVYASWMLQVEKIRRKNQAIMEACRELGSRLESDGFRSCILKGQGIARLYPDPSLRQSGDIDIWMEGGMDRILPYLKSRYPVSHIVYHHCDVKVFDKIPVEIHFTPSWFNSFPMNSRLQEWFSANSEAQFSNYDAELGFCHTTPSFDAVFLMIHIFRHLLFEGVGLRQLMDYYYVLSSLTREEREASSASVAALGLSGFASSLMWLMGEVFFLSEDRMLCSPDEDGGKFFLEEVMKAGNFGKYDERNTVKDTDSVIKRAAGRTGRLVKFLRYYPKEVLWAPVFKAWQYFWKKKNNY